MLLQSTRTASLVGSALGVMVGCLVGMFPLLFMPDSEVMEAVKRKEKVTLWYLPCKIWYVFSRVLVVFMTPQELYLREVFSGTCVGSFSRVWIRDRPPLSPADLQHSFVSPEALLLEG